MGSFKKIFKNTFILALARLAQPACSLILVIFIARTIGANLLGSYDIVLSYLAVFQMIATFGFKYILSREIAKNKDISLKLCFHAMVTIIPLSVICFFLMIFLSHLFDYPAEVKTAILISGITLLSTSIIDMCEGVHIGLGNLKQFSGVIFFENFLRLIVSIIAVWLGGKLLSIVIILSVTRFLAMIFHLIIVKKNVPHWTIKFDFAFFKWLFSTSYIIAITLILVAIYGRTDVFMLSKLSGIEEVGYYGVAYRFILVNQLFISSFTSNVFPSLAKFINFTGNEVHDFCVNSIKYLLFLAFPIILLITLSADKIVYLLFGSAFTLSVPILQILIWMILPYSFIAVANYILLSTNNQKIDLQINFFVAIISIFLNLLFIPMLGAKGAAIATLLSTISYFIIQYRFLYKNIIKLDLFQIFRSPIVFNLILGMVFIALKQKGLLIAYSISLLTYASILYFYFFYSKNKKFLC